ncbi:MAG: chemotaxis protein CheW [Nitrospirota bacterium]
MSGGAVSETTQCLTFILGEEIYSLEIARVREVLDYTIITRVPRTPGYMPGVINLRGGVVPVVDLRLKFGMPAIDVSVNTCVIIVEARVDGDLIILGLLADSVQEVLDLDRESIKPAPRIGTKLDTGFIRGMGRQNERFIIILDIDKVFSTEALALVQAGQHDGPEDHEKKRFNRLQGEQECSKT